MVLGAGQKRTSIKLNLATISQTTINATGDTICTILSLYEVSINITTLLVHLKQAQYEWLVSVNYHCKSEYITTMSFWSGALVLPSSDQMCGQPDATTLETPAMSERYSTARLGVKKNQSDPTCSVNLLTYIVFGDKACLQRTV